MAHQLQHQDSPPTPASPQHPQTTTTTATITTTLHFKHGETRQVHDFVLARLALPSGSRDHALCISVAAGDVLLYWLYTGTLDILTTPTSPAPVPPQNTTVATAAAAAATVKLSIILELIAFSASYHQHISGLDPLLHARAAHLAQQKDLDPAAVLELVQRAFGRAGDVSRLDWLRDCVRAAPAADLHTFIRGQMTMEDCGGGGDGGGGDGGGGDGGGGDGGGGGGLAGRRGPVLSARELVLCTLVTAEMQHTREAQGQAAKLRSFADEVRELVKDWEAQGNAEGRQHPLYLRLAVCLQELTE
ncbi:hypothetical protein MN608_00236 [Microdochium nivale]|nr:hypothetical protein MN608_00236 [Microdochium nivale]